ncbi:MAG: hypothetical protein IJR70_03750 [Eubacterium sp.]|nr:hypothetical protein [Eubacterium sp.]
MKKVLSVFLAVIMMISAFGAVVNASAQGSEVLSYTQSLLMSSKKKKVTSKQRKAFFKKAAFIGSSIGVGQRMYFDSEGYKTVGKPTMLVRGCYSFYNDKHSRSKWMVTYKGTPMQAKKAIKKCKCNRVFIAMGTNDFHGNANVVFDDYVEYLKGIRKANPKVVIFIESTTSVTSSHQGKYLNSKNIKKLNEKLKEYCKEHKDMYFIDVSSKLNDKKGHLKKKYASDNYCHLTNSAYKIWTNQLVKYTDKLMLKESEAKKAVKAAEKSKTEKKVKAAKKLVDKLEKSTVKSNLRKRLKKIKVKTTAKKTTTSTTVIEKEEQD